MLTVTMTAARVNASMRQEEVASTLTEMLGETVTRQKISYYEQHPENTPIKYVKALSKIYNIPEDNIFFNC